MSGPGGIVGAVLFVIITNILVVIAWNYTDPLVRKMPEGRKQTIAMWANNLTALAAVILIAWVTTILWSES